MFADSVVEGDNFLGVDRLVVEIVENVDDLIESVLFFGFQPLPAIGHRRPQSDLISGVERLYL